MSNDLERRLDQVQLETEHLQMELVEAIEVGKLRRVHGLVESQPTSVKGEGAEVLLGELMKALEEVKVLLGKGLT
jgi:hypothetical protein